MTTIGKIRIKAVRGIRSELSLDLDGRSLLLRGDNGTGKSSIAQALRWAVTGSPTSPTSSALPPEFQRHRLETDPAASEVTVDLVPSGRIVMKAGLRDDVQTDDVGRAYVDACVRSNPFLQRDELLGFLSNSPGDRYKYLERFLELDRAERLGASLGPLAKEHESLAKAAQTERDRLLSLATSRLPSPAPAPRSFGELLARTVDRARALGFAVQDVSAVSDLDAVRTKLGATAPNNATTERRVELAGALERARALVPPDHPRTLLERLRDAEQRALETDLASLLGHALDVVEKHPSLETCPVCEQSVEVAALTTRLRARLAVLAEVREAAQLASELGGEWREFLVALDGLERLACAGASERTVYATGRALLQELDQRDGDTLASRILARVETVRRTLKEEHDRIPDNLRASELAALATGIGAVLASKGDIERREAELDRHTQLAVQIRAVEKAVGDARKNVADRILKGIASQVASFYERIHPPGAADEVTGAPSIKVKRHGSGTAHVRGLFNKEEIDDPRHIYSDGHLDTVGICVFLALRKQSSAGPKLLVLDDVVLSIDLGHADRLVKLLRDEFADHQILILSHNELFMRMCRGPLSGAKQLEIVRWTLEHGPRIASRVTHADELAKKLEESGSAEMVASAMRPVLDDLLVGACCAFEVKLPATSDRGLTVDEYWAPLRKKLETLTKERLLPDLSAVFDEIGAPSFFRNALGAHLNEWALEVALSQVQRVARGVLGLLHALECPSCKTIRRLADPRVLASGLTCECPTKRRPALAPSHASTTESAS